jgi:hypothetical protein
MSGSHLVLSEQLTLLQDEIALLRASCRDALAEADAAGLIRAPKMPIDDVFLLRFLLSNGRTAATAADNLTSCIRWRIQNKEKIAAIHNGMPFRGILTYIYVICVYNAVLVCGNRTNFSISWHLNHNLTNVSRVACRARRLWSAASLGETQTIHVRWSSRRTERRLAHRHRARGHLEYCRYAVTRCCCWRWRRCCRFMPT